MFTPDFFIGREKEIMEISQCIEQWGIRWVICINGDGGIGKTRLLQEIQKKYLQREHQVISSGRPQVNIVFIHKSNASEWERELFYGAEQMGKDLGIELSQIDASDGMLSALKKILQQKERPHALIIRGTNINENIYTEIQECIRQGIKILTLDNRLDIPGIATQVFHDGPEGIERAARQLVKDINYGGKIAVIKGDDDLENNRTDIFNNVIQNYYQISCVTTIHASVEPKKEIPEQLKRLLNTYSDLKAIWTTRNELAKIALQTLKGTNIVVYSFDLLPKDVHYMIDTKSPWKVAVVTDPLESGRMMVRLATQAAYGYSIDPFYMVRPRLLTQEELRDRSDDEAFLTGAADNKIGWTPEITSMLLTAKPNLRVFEILDFDNLSLRNPEKLSQEIAKMLGGQAFQEAFKEFLQGQIDYRTMQKSGVSAKALSEKHQMNNRQFVESFNNISERERILLCFDTTDDLTSEDDIWKDWQAQIPQLKNVTVLIAGRNADKIHISLSSSFGQGIRLHDLSPLSIQDSLQYLQKRRAQRHITIESDLADILVFLANGRPILLDMAVEWRARGITLDWIIQGNTLENLNRLDKKHKKQKQDEFEEALVNTIETLDKPYHRELILLMAYVHPLNVKMIADFMEIGLPEAQRLFEEMKKYIFVKQMPNGYIKLHDDVQPMVNRYLWDKKLDPERDQRHWYSSKALTYFTKEIDNLLQHISQYKETLQEDVQRKQQPTKEGQQLEIALQIEALEQQVWVLREQQLFHALEINVDGGITLFQRLFDEATKTARFEERRKLFALVIQKAKRLSPDQQYILDIRRVKTFLTEGQRDYWDDANALCERMLQKQEVKKSLDRLIETHIALGNAKIKLGNVNAGLVDFQEAVKKSETSPDLMHWRIKSLNELGWAYRQEGNFEEAANHYDLARELCLQKGGSENEELQYDYGMILNNLAFVLSYNSKTRDDAMSYAHEAIELWERIGNKIGLGAGYHVLGVTLYRANRFELALEAFNKAEAIFGPLKHEEWLARVYSWRGAIFRTQKKYDDAQKELDDALSKGSDNDKAMTLARLGRLYRSKMELDRAKKYFEESIDHAKEIPDYDSWLVSLSKLIQIEADQGHYTEFDQLYERFEKETKNIPYHTDNYGLACLALAQLLFGQNNAEKVAQIISLLKKGIPKIMEFGTYAKRDGVSRVKELEKEFASITPEIIREVGKELKQFVIEEAQKNPAYKTITGMIFRWANWKAGKGGEVK